MTLAKEPMTRRVVIVPPEVSLRAAWLIMERERFRHLPVVKAGAIVGMLSDRDVLARATLQGATKVEVPADVTVGEAMSPAPYVCRPDTDVRDIVRLMTEKKIDACPVINGADRLVGLVTSTDLMLLLLNLDEVKLPIPFQFELEELEAIAA